MNGEKGNNKNEALLEALLKYHEKQEEKYLQNIAKKFVANKTKNYMLARSIIIDIHLYCEFFVSAFITYLLGISSVKFGINKKTVDELCNSALEPVSKIEYSKKLKVFEQLNVFSRENIKILWAINDLRNAFAHGDKMDSSRYNYKGESIFTKSGIDTAYKDFQKVVKEFDGIDSDEKV